MVNKLFSIVFSLALFFWLASCDKIEEPYTTQPHTTPTDTITQVKKVLLEDYTGHLCVNCPDAHEVLYQLMATYPNQIIPIALHVGGNAEPIPGSDYKDDFRTPEGGQLDTIFGCSDAGLPVGMVNRKKVDGNRLLPKDKWGSVVDELLNTQQTIDIKINNSYAPASRTLTTQITINYLADFPNDSLYVVAYLTEDSIIAAQKTHDGDDKNYVHMHMMRGSFNGTWGEALTPPFTANTSANKTYSMVLNEQFKPEHCHVVVFVYNNNSSADNYYEIYQADEARVEN